jgi:hypothetical protein
VVDGAETLFPILKELPERFLLIKHAEPGGGREVISINRQINPVVDIRLGELQFWRIAHIGATLFAPFRFEGVSLYVVDACIRSRRRASKSVADSRPRADFRACRHQSCPSLHELGRSPSPAADWR